MDKIIDKFGKLSRREKIDVLWNALGYMEQHNGRSKWQCVALAMGYDID